LLVPIIDGTKGRQDRCSRRAGGSRLASCLLLTAFRTRAHGKARSLRHRSGSGTILARGVQAYIRCLPRPSQATYLDVGSRAVKDRSASKAGHPPSPMRLAGTSKPDLAADGVQGSSSPQNRADHPRQGIGIDIPVHQDPHAVLQHDLDPSRRHCGTWPIGSKRFSLRRLLRGDRRSYQRRGEVRRWTCSKRELRWPGTDGPRSNRRIGRTHLSRSCR
jgi:hypothetical protein